MLLSFFIIFCLFFCFHLFSRS